MGSVPVCILNEIYGSLDVPQHNLYTVVSTGLDPFFTSCKTKHQFSTTHTHKKHSTLIPCLSRQTFHKKTTSYESPIYQKHRETEWIKKKNLHHTPWLHTSTYQRVFTRPGSYINLRMMSSITSNMEGAPSHEFQQQKCLFHNV